MGSFRGRFQYVTVIVVKSRGSIEERVAYHRRAQREFVVPANKGFEGDGKTTTIKKNEVTAESYLLTRIKKTTHQ